jgi:hypothetical protein
MPQRLYPPVRPQSAGAILDSAFHILAASLVKTLPYGILIILAGQLGNIYRLIVGRPIGRRAPMDLQTVLIFLATLVLVILLCAALQLRQRAIAAGEPTSMRGELTRAWRRLPALLGLAILAMLAIGGGFLCLLLPGLYLCVAVTMGQPALLFENKGPITALKRSLQLVRGHWWRTCGVLAVAFIIVMVFYLLAAIVATILVRFAHGSDLALISAAATVLLIALGAFSTPFLSATTLAVYGDLYQRHATTPDGKSG